MTVNFLEYTNQVINNNKLTVDEKPHHQLIQTIENYPSQFIRALNNKSGTLL